MSTKKKDRKEWIEFLMKNYEMTEVQAEQLYEVKKEANEAFHSVLEHVPEDKTSDAINAIAHLESLYENMGWLKGFVQATNKAKNDLERK